MHAFRLIALTALAIPALAACEHRGPPHDNPAWHNGHHCPPGQAKKANC